MTRLLPGLLMAIGLAGIAQSASAKVIKLEIVRVESPAFEGRSFGSVGTYDRIIARTTVAVSPSGRHNTIIVDIDRAPRNAQGLVEATADVEILRPTNAASGNRRLLYDVVNRGAQRAIAYFNDGPSGNDFSKAATAGNGFLMNRGYTVVISGWQGDLDARPGWQTISVPVVPNVAGLSREEFIFEHARNPAVADLTYPASDPDVSKARLTVRQRETDPRATPTDLSFTFAGPDKVSINRPAGFDAGAIYELIYLAKDPKVMGMGFAATRDIVSFLRRETADATGTPNPIAGRIDHAIALGVSQSGRFLHDLLYLGFNEDEAGRVVFDGLIPHIAAGKKMFTNYRFAQPGRNMQEHGETLYPGTAFPFSYPVTTDAITGRTDGWLARCLAAGNCPKIFQTDTDLEFYQSFGSLVVTDTKGEPLTMPDNVRLYYLSSLQHAATAGAKSGLNPICTYPTNPLYAGPVLRALLVAMDAWIASDTAPPASRYPSRADGTLVPPSAEAVAFPTIPGFGYGGLVHRPTVVDHSEMPPAKKAVYPLFVPKTDADGNAVAGVRLPTLVAPVATHTGWNLRKAGFAEGALCGNIGSMIPFAKTKEDRQKAGDPRLSLAERYPNPGDRAAVIERTARQLVQDRLLLEDDVQSYLQATN
jgi:Alpha/beta hydrolase domain